MKALATIWETELEVISRPPFESQPMPTTTEPVHQLFDDNTMEESPVVNTFIYAGSISLHRSARLQRRSEGRPSASKGALCRVTKATSIVSMQVSSITAEGAHASHHYYASQIASFDNFLDLSFDGGSTAINPVAHSASMTDNEVCTLGEMKRQLDRAMFEEAMVK